MDANLKQLWYERVTKSKSLSELKEQIVTDEIKAGLYEGEELKNKYGEQNAHRAHLLVHQYLFDIDGEIKTNKELGDVLQSSASYWDCKAIQHWILAKDDYVAGEDLRKNLHLQKQAKANAKAFRGWRNKFSKFREYQNNTEPNETKELRYI